MQFFIDTADVDAIRELHDLGMVDGVTTNPSLILKSGRDILEVTKEICSFVKGPVSAEVVALKAEDMIAEKFQSLVGTRPVTSAGQRGNVRQRLIEQYQTEYYRGQRHGE